MSPEELWQNVLKTALLGTDRAALPSLVADGPLGEALATVDHSNPTRALLDAAALLTIYRGAGQDLPLNTAPLPPRCDPDELPEVSREASHAYQLAISTHDGLVIDWIQHALAAGRRVRSEALPKFLTHFKNPDKAGRGLAVTVIGRRGYWLASFDSAFAWVNHVTPDPAFTVMDFLNAYDTPPAKAHSPVRQMLNLETPGEALTEFRHYTDKPNAEFVPSDAWVLQTFAFHLPLVFAEAWSTLVTRPLSIYKRQKKLANQLLDIVSVRGFIEDAFHLHPS